MRYEAPNTVDAAVALLAGESGMARVLAGGTDLLVQLRAGFVEPDLIVDLKRIEGLRKLWPGVVEATELIGSTQIQGRATMAGNLCNASPAADSVPALVAAGAVATVIGPKGRRELPVEEVAAGPGKTTLGKGELVESVFLPARPANSGDAYLRFIPRTEMDIAVVGAGVSLSLDGDGTCSAARVALGAVAPRVLLVEAAAKALVGTKLDDGALARLDEAARAACQPIDDKRGTIEFRTKVAGVLARRAAAIALSRARGK
jgi:carbon-monoxide dehydrogenase medium subunit